MLTIKEVTVVTEAPLDSQHTQRLSTDIGEAIIQRWHDTGNRSALVVDRLTIDAPPAELAKPEFARDVARATVDRLLKRRGE